MMIAYNFITNDIFFAEFLLLWNSTNFILSTPKWHVTVYSGRRNQHNEKTFVYRKSCSGVTKRSWSNWYERCTLWLDEHGAISPKIWVVRITGNTARHVCPRQYRFESCTAPALYMRPRWCGSLHLAYIQRFEVRFLVGVPPESFWHCLLFFLLKT